jgi:geranylgeranyl diphosphate synthase type I
MYGVSQDFNHMNVIENTPREISRERPLFERYRDPVDSYMRDLLAQTDGLAGRMIEYHLGFRERSGESSEAGSGGKALRPTLCLLTVDAVGGNWENAVPAAAGLELFHNFTLIHDDIQDGDITRRGKSTVWMEWGKEQAINAGDAAHLLSSRAILDLSARGYSAEQVLEAHQLLTDTGIQIVDGQTMDIDFERRTEVRVEEYMKMIRRKTGVFFETAIEMGAILGSAEDDTREALREYGSAIGVAFQITDDILGVWGDPVKTGKPVGEDIRRRKKAYPAVSALATDNDVLRRKLVSIYETKDELVDQDVEDVMTIFEELGIRRRAQALVDQATFEADVAISRAAIDESLKVDFHELASLLATREK